MGKSLVSCFFETQCSVTTHPFEDSLQLIVIDLYMSSLSSDLIHTVVCPLLSLAEECQVIIILEHAIFAQKALNIFQWSEGVSKYSY